MPARALARLALAACVLAACGEREEAPAKPEPAPTARDAASVRPTSGALPPAPLASWQARQKGSSLAASLALVMGSPVSTTTRDGLPGSSA